MHSELGDNDNLFDSEQAAENAAYRDKPQTDGTSPTPDWALDWGIERWDGIKDIFNPTQFELC
jgi:hypothetical protein